MTSRPHVELWTDAHTITVFIVFKHLRGLLQQLRIQKYRSFALFNDTWSQQGHSVTCTSALTLFSMPANHQIRHKVTYNGAVSLVIACGFLLFTGDLYEYVHVWVKVLTELPPRVHKSLVMCPLITQMIKCSSS